MHGNAYGVPKYVGGVSIRNRLGIPSRKGCVVNGENTKASTNGLSFPANDPRRRGLNGLLLGCTHSESNKKG